MFLFIPGDDPPWLRILAQSYRAIFQSIARIFHRATSACPADASGECGCLTRAAGDEVKLRHGGRGVTGAIHEATSGRGSPGISELNYTATGSNLVFGWDGLNFRKQAPLRRISESLALLDYPGNQ